MNSEEMASTYNSKIRVTTAFPYMVARKITPVEFFGKKYNLHMPVLVKATKLMFVDYAINENKGLVTETIGKISPVYMYDVYMKDPSAHILVCVVTVQTETVPSIEALIENIPNKVAAFYGTEAKEKYLSERKEFFDLFPGEEVPNL